MRKKHNHQDSQLTETGISRVCTELTLTVEMGMGAIFKRHCTLPSV